MKTIPFNLVKQKTIKEQNDMLFEAIIEDNPKKYPIHCFVADNNHNTDIHYMRVGDAYFYGEYSFNFNPFLTENYIVKSWQVLEPEDYLIFCGEKTENPLMVVVCAPNA